MGNTKTKTAKITAGVPVLVTTEHRGVFFGYMIGEAAKAKVLLQRARNCVFWDAASRGFVGLAESGPTKGCRVGPAAPEMTLFDITSVLTCTPEAVERWEAAPWQP